MHLSTVCPNHVATYTYQLVAWRKVGIGWEFDHIGSQYAPPWPEVKTPTLDPGVQVGICTGTGLNLLVNPLFAAWYILFFDVLSVKCFTYRCRHVSYQIPPTGKGGITMGHTIDRCITM